ncbi:hypothetical protein K8Q94_01650 [Candidatus Nomurabacteria bacterium]|nr:hypothetical protein [Candidatus Nomurabacteria bacterium]
MEKGPENIINIDRKYLQIDRENLEPQLEKISDVLLKISEDDRFDTFSHFAQLADISANENIDPANSLKLLENWNYESIDFIQKEKSGNCVDFAILCQKMLADVGVPTTIIGRFAEKKDYAPRQADFLKYRHITPMYANESHGLKVFVLEPSWKFSKPVPVALGVTSIYKDWISEVSSVNGAQFTQKTYNPQKNKHRERLFDIHPLDVDFCRQLTKRFIRVPRELKILNTNDEEIIQFVKFDAKKQMFVTNIEGVDPEFSPNAITPEQSRVLEEVLGKPELTVYLSKVFNFIKSLPNDFWIKD